MTSTAASKAAALEGLDFIETEEDVKAVEAATLKIQSTFRGKKFRSKQAAPKSAAGPEKPAPDSGTTKTNLDEKNSEDDANRKREEAAESSRSELELSRKVAAMQVQDNTNQMGDTAHAKGANVSTSGAGGEDEAERAATKIQAGFKGYKTRKELEGKLPAGSAGGGAPDDQGKGGS